MMPIEIGILLKKYISCNFMLKYYITVSLRQFTKALNKFFDLSRANEKSLCDLCSWMIQSSFDVNFVG